MKNIILWGASGQAIVVEEFLSQLGYKLIAVFDNNKVVKSPFESIPIYHGTTGFYNWLKTKKDTKNVSYTVTIGGSRGQERMDIYNMLASAGLQGVSIVHPTSFVANSAFIANGCQILANTAISAKTHLGLATIVNTSASLDHECVISKGVHIAPGATLAGCVQVGDFSFIGAGATILPRIRIGKNTIIGAGSVVTKNIPDNVVAYGNPARIIRDNC